MAEAENRNIQSLLAFREIYMNYYERLIAQLGERTITGEVEGSNPS